VPDRLAPQGSRTINLSNPNLTMAGLCVAILKELESSAKLWPVMRRPRFAARATQLSRVPFRTLDDELNEPSVPTERN
jgi:hypothetical protein